MLRVTVFKQKRDKYYSLKFPFNEELREKIKTYEKRDWDNENKCWRVPVFNLHSIISSYRGKKDEIFFSFEPETLRESFIDDYKNSLEDAIAEEKYIKESTANYYERKSKARNYIIKYDKDSSFPPAPYGLKPNVVPFRHQLIGANFLNYINSGLLAMEQGTGKSLTALLSVLYDKTINKILVICPASLKLNWANEVHNFTYEKAFVLKHDKNPYPIEECKFIITNYEFFNASKFNEKKILTPYGLYKGVDLLILDESHRVANSTSNTSRNIKRSFHKYINKCFLLSGTPIKNRLPELFPQLHLIAPFEFKTKAEFLGKYCGQEFDGLTWQQVTRANPDQMYEDLKGLMYRVKKKDVLDLPPVIHTKVMVELTKDEKTEYNKILTELKKIDATGLDISSEQTVKPIIEIIIKLRQFTSMVKAKSTIQMINDLNAENHKVVIFDSYKTPLKYINDKIKNGALYTGEVSTTDRQQIVDKFQSDSPEISNFVSTIGAGNVGITLTKASYMIMNSQSYVPAENSQAWARIDRIGQIEPCNIYTLVCVDTIDETIYHIVNAKSNTISSAIDGEKFQNTSVTSVLLDIVKTLL